MIAELRRGSDAGAGGGLGRARACARLGDCGLAAGRPLFCAPGNAGIAEEAECVAIRATDIEGLVRFCRRSGSISSSSVPRRRWSWGSSTRSRRRASRFRPERRGGRARRLEGLCQGFCAAGADPDRRLRRFRDADAAKAYIAAMARPLSSRPRACRRQGGRGRRRPRRGLGGRRRGNGRPPVSARPGARWSSRSFWRARR